MKKVILAACAALAMGMYLFPQQTQAATSDQPLSDGIYKIGKKEQKKYYYVFNNTRVKLKKGKTFDTLLQFAQQGAFVPVSETTFSELISLKTNSCEFYTHLPEDAYQDFLDCSAAYEKKQELATTLDGKMIIRVDGNGELYYVQNKDTYKATEIKKRVPLYNKTLHSYMKSIAEKTTKKQLLAVPRWEGQNL